jgi:hypothetical protein
LVAFDVFLGSVVFVPVSLQMIDIAEAFMVGIEGITSECFLWHLVCERVMMS